MTVIDLAIHINEAICIFLVASAALIYAASCLVYIRNKEQFCTDPLFHDDILDNPLKAAFMLTIKLEVDQQRYMYLQNTLLPQFSQVFSNI